MYVYIYIYIYTTHICINTFNCLFIYIYDIAPFARRPACPGVVDIYNNDNGHNPYYCNTNNM